MIIGITGYAQSGKSSIGQILCERQWIKTAFAAPLKAMLQTMGLSHEQLYGVFKEVPSNLLCGKTPRFAMQTLGTEWRDLIGQDLWTRIWLKEIRRLQAEGESNIFVDDLRFPHEVEAVRKLKGKIWKVQRQGVAKAFDHASENLIDGLEFDVLIQNNKSLEVLRQNILGQLYLYGEAIL